MLTDDDVKRGATALIVEVVDAVIRKTGLSARGLLGTELAKDVSSYRPRNGKPQHSISEQKLRQIINAISSHLDAGDEEILLHAWEIEQHTNFKLPLARGALLFGLKQSEARKILAKLASSKLQKTLGRAQGVRNVLQIKSLGAFRSEPKEMLPSGSVRRPMPGELLARALLAIADAHLDQFADDKVLQAFEHAQICSEAAMVVGWYARQAKDSVVLATAREQAYKADKLADNQQLRLNLILLDCYAADLGGPPVNVYERFKEAIQFPRLGLPPLPNVQRSVARRCAKAFALSSTNPFDDVVHEGMSAFRWLLALRRQAEEIGAYDSVIVVDAVIIESAVKRFGQSNDRIFKVHCYDTALKAWADLTFRMLESRRYVTVATRKTRSDCLEHLQPLFAQQQQFERIE